MKLCRNVISGFKAAAFGLLIAGALTLPAPAVADSGDDELNKYVRILHQGAPRYGVLSLGQARLLDKSFFGDDPKYTGEVVPLKRRFLRLLTEVDFAEAGTPNCCLTGEFLRVGAVDFLADGPTHRPALWTK